MKGFDREKKDIVEEKTREEYLKIAVEEAEADSQAKSEFINRLSHDIRTPLNAIIGMTDIAAANIDNKGRVLDCLEKIALSGNHLLKLINEILDMNKIASGNPQIRESEINLSDMMDDMLAMVRPQIDAKNHLLKVKLHNIIHEEVLGDPLRIKEIFVNLMSNAIKYTDNGGSITIEIIEKESQIKDMAFYEFVFRDNGIGMDSEFVKHIFDPFARADNTGVTKVQGTGLGMTIARNIARMMGGDIRVKSIPKEGSEFIVTMYLKYCRREEEKENRCRNFSVLIADDMETGKSAAELLENRGIHCDICTDGMEAVNMIEKKNREGKHYNVVFLGETLEHYNYIDTIAKIRKITELDATVPVLMSYDLGKVQEEAEKAGITEFITKPLFFSKMLRLFDKISERGGRKQKAGNGKLKMADFSGYRVLIVEDNDLNLEIASEIIGAAGASVETAGNGLDAIQMLKKLPEGYFDLILMDIRMPEMDGYKATMEIRRLGRKDVKDIPIIAMTANAFADDVAMSRDAGMNDHIVKPLNMTVLFQTLEKWLPGKKNIDEYKPFVL